MTKSVVPVTGLVELAAEIEAENLDEYRECEFEIYRLDASSDGPPKRKVVDTVKTAMTAGKASTSWAAKGVEGNESSCLLHVKVKANDLSYETDEVIEVYVDEVEVTAVDAEDKPVSHALFRLGVEGDTSRNHTTRRTESNGKVTVKKLPPGAIKIDWVDPFELTRWIQADGPKRKAEVLRKSYKAKLSFPKPAGKDPHIQYVNMPADPANPEYGNIIKVAVGVDMGIGKEGDVVYLKAEFEPSLRSRPVRTIVGGVQNGLVSTHNLPIGGPQLVAVFDVELGMGGGDKVKLSVGSTAACSDQTVEIQNWRKIVYEVTVPDRWNVPTGLPPATKDAMDQEYAKAYIELEALGVNQLDTTQSPVSGIDFYVGSRATMGSSVDPLFFYNSQSPNFGNFATHRAALPVDVQYYSYLHIVLVSHLAGDFPEDTFTFTLTGTESAWIPATKGTQLVLEPASTLVGATMTWTATNTVSQIPFLDSWVAVDPKTRGARFRVKVPDTVVDGAGKGPSKRNPLKVELRLRAVKPDAAGRSISGIVATSYKKDGPRQMMQALAHEIGHFYKQAAVAEATVPGLDLNAHTFRYGAGTGEGQHGHSGPHCRKGFPQKYWAEKDYSKVYQDKKVHGTCVMWGGAVKEEGKVPIEFCPDCLKFLTACDRKG